VIAERLHELAQAGELQLPPPGTGQTRQRWAALAGFAREDVVLGRLAEAHTDAAAILVELGAQPVQPGQVWGVWAAEPPVPVVHAHRVGEHWQLSGQKLWCSGAHTCTHTLLTARVGEQRALFAVDLAQEGVRAVPDTWPAVGMAASDSGAVDLDRADAVMVGAAGDYLSRPGFWHGAIGVGASWYGGACGVADALLAKASAGRADEHALAHLGHVSTALSGARWALSAAARRWMQTHAMSRELPRAAPTGYVRWWRRRRQRPSSMSDGRWAPVHCVPTARTPAGWPTSPCTYGRVMQSATSPCWVGSLPRTVRPGERGHCAHLR